MATVRSERLDKQDFWRKAVAKQIRYKLTQKKYIEL